MSNKALYRIWRPQSLNDVVGQTYVIKTLKNAISNNKVMHAYLFSGPRGTGKTSVGRIFAKAINCMKSKESEPCNECTNCISITEGKSLDVTEMDAASNRGVDEIRDIRDKVKFGTTQSKYKIYIIDEAHMLTTEAFNALLKVLEEPPAHVIFMLATTESQKIPKTIISRCQSFQFNKISSDRIADRLQEIMLSYDVKTAADHLQMIAKTADGGMRDAIVLLEQIITLGGPNFSEEDVLAVTGAVSVSLINKFVDIICDQNISKVNVYLKDILSKGYCPKVILKELIYSFREMLHRARPDEMKAIIEKIETLIHYEQKINLVYPEIILELAVVNVSLPKEINNKGTAVKGEFKKYTIASKKTESNEGLEQKEAESVTLSSDTKTVDLNANWPKFLEAIKKDRITVHAWLIAGRPHRIEGDCLVISFSSKIHCESIMKESNVKVVLARIGEYYTGITKFKAIMEQDDKLQQTTELPEKNRAYDEAVNFFGTNLVENKNNN